ncbi:MAG: hypothetical protein AABZ53_02040 [Planctomycetota bacterium]
MKISALVLSVAAGACASLVSQASAQYSTNFDSYTPGSIVGQDSWIQPVAGSNDWQAQALNDPANFNVCPSPDSGTQTGVATCYLSAATFARSQHPMNWADHGTWTICMDFWADYQAADPLLHASNVGSFSVQPTGSQGPNMLWYYNTDGDVTSDYSISWNLFDSAGGAALGFYNPDDVAGTWPSGPFSEFKYRKWYRASYVVNLDTGEVTKMGVKNLESGAAATFISTGTLFGTTANGNWNTEGGENNIEAKPKPNQFRMFVGGQGNGNVMAFDNISFTPGDSLCVSDSPAGCPADFDGDGTVDFFDYDAFVVCFEGGACPNCRTADFDGDGTPDFFDYDAFVVTFEAPCP